MAHSHEHSHGNAGENDYSRAFAMGIGLNIAFVAVEIIYGLIANSSALLADAGHNASDVLGLVFAWTASRLATIKPKGKYTYGLRKTTILVSILNALLLFGAVTAITIGLQNRNNRFGISHPGGITGQVGIWVEPFFVIIVAAGDQCHHEQNP